MPAIVGPIQIISVSGGVVQFGDTVWDSPKSTSKVFSGSGGFNTGLLIISNNGISNTNTLNTNLVDQPIIGNN